MADDERTTLREITRATYEAVLRLRVGPEQDGMVASNATSLAQALYHKEAWCRGIYSGDTVVGFVMLELWPEKAEYGIWRLMIAAEHQGQGHGRRAVALVVDHIRAQPAATEVVLSHVQKSGNPGPFYEACGFEYTGELNGTEPIMRLVL